MLNASRFAKIAALTVIAVATSTLSASAATTIADFDPDEDIIVELDKYGSELPDPTQMEQVFAKQYPALDKCVAAEKRRTKQDAKIDGFANLAIKLNPKGGSPEAVHADVPKDLQTRGKLVHCLRVAAAKAPYPGYDGPPSIVAFDFEIDPGYEDEVEE